MLIEAIVFLELFDHQPLDLRDELGQSARESSENERTHLEKLSAWVLMRQLPANQLSLHQLRGRVCIMERVDNLRQLRLLVRARGEREEEARKIDGCRDQEVQHVSVTQPRLILGAAR